MAARSPQSKLRSLLAPGIGCGDRGVCVKLKDCEEPIPEGKSAQAASFATHANQIEVGVGQCVKLSLKRPTLPLD